MRQMFSGVFSRFSFWTCSVLPRVSVRSIQDLDTFRKDSGPTFRWTLPWPPAVRRLVPKKRPSAFWCCIGPERIMSRAAPGKPLLYHYLTQIEPVAQLAPPDLANKRPLPVKGTGYVFASRSFLHGAPCAVADRLSDLVAVQAIEADQRACHLNGISVSDMGHRTVQRCPRPSRIADLSTSFAAFGS